MHGIALGVAVEEFLPPRIVSSTCLVDVNSDRSFLPQQVR